MVALAGPLIAFGALLVWVVGLPLAALDALTAALFAVGLGLSALTWIRARAQLALFGLGFNAAGLVMLAILYAAG